ncbi:DNA polymerase delta small subunit Cdc1 [Tilletia horrida]|uniref:DNA polymerase delta small subunit Cdc1 n=1 Tax=Tilletia horrida TaxID=155126 RepID=A0AAN6JQ34_9BASI|nr:DNA polymerase delta small subunit Cdc1 [Tilletia horrida]KAK0546469.1 DNA polymerase delta small subunit Cdc1 [Tilletia horrida]
MPAKHKIVHRQDPGFDSLSALSDRLTCPLGARLYQRQYAALYDFRLRVLRKRVEKRAAAKWAEVDAAERVHVQLRSESQTDIKGEDDDEDYSEEQDDDVNMDEEGDEVVPAGRRKAAASLSALDSASEMVLEPPKYVKRILEINQGEVCYIIGTLYCAMPLKPDVLEDLTREQWLPPQPLREKYLDKERDQLYIEDESGRVRLVGEPLRWGHESKLRNMCVTGVVVAVLGTETRHGDFTVADIVFPSVPQSLGPLSRPVRAAVDEEEEDEDDTKMALDQTASQQKDEWLAFVSGLELGPSSTSDTDASSSSAAKTEPDETPVGNQQVNGHSTASAVVPPDVRAQMLTEWLTGELGDEDERISSANVVGLVVAGNSMAKPIRVDEERKTRKFGAAAAAATTARPTLALDQFLTDISATMDVFILPGERDPTSLALPQQPIHFALLPRASRFQSCRRLTNPAWFGTGGKRILGTAGQNVDDLYKYAEEEDEGRILMAARTLEWGHVAPTAPDTLWCYPFNTDDPFLLREAPDVYFVGNQPEFGTSLYDSPDGHQTRVVLIPRFSQTGDIVLVNLRTLACEVVHIDAAV